MKEQLIRAMTGLVRYEICGEPLEESVAASLSDEFLRQLYELARRHDLAHIVGAALQQNGLIKENEIGVRFKKQIGMAIYRFEKGDYEYGRICRAFEEEKITFLPLKGAVIKQYYKEPWMRTSCDIDILIHEEDLPAASRCLKEELNYSIKSRNYHDVSFFSESGVHLELHFSIQENNAALDAVLQTVWTHASPVESDSVRYELSPAFLMFYLSAHMSYHFMTGGCGVRSVMDFRILEEHLSYDALALNGFLRESGLVKFFEAISDLSKLWFGNGVESPLLIRMQEYIVSGGVYGNARNSAMAVQETSPTKKEYFFKRIWMPYDTIRMQYPVLNRHKGLLLICQIRRWGRFLFRGRFLRGIDEVKSVFSVPKNEAVSAMFRELDLPQ